MKSAASARVFLSGERGAVIPIFGFVILVMLVLAAFAVDLGYIIMARQQLQNAADAAVLAAVPGMILEEPEKTEEVQRRVIEMCSHFSIGNDESVSIVPEEDIVVEGNKLTVYTRKLKSRNNGLPLFFARILRMPYANVTAKAAVLVRKTSVACCVKPWAMPDLWDDETIISGHENWHENGRWDGEDFQDWNDNRLWDAGEPFNDQNHNGKYDGEYYDRGLSRANEAGYIPSLPPDGHIGTRVTLKFGEHEHRPAESFFSAVVLPWPEGEESPSGGAKRYEESIVRCNPSIIDGEQELELESEPGNMAGATESGARTIIARDPNAFWNTELNAVDHSDGDALGESPRIVLVPVFDPRLWPEEGRLSEHRGNTVVITKIVAVFIERTEHHAIIGRLTTTPISCLGGTAPGDGGPGFTYTYQMVE